MILFYLFILDFFFFLQYQKQPYGKEKKQDISILIREIK